MNVLIIGAGIVGACLAHYLARGGARVTVIERARAGHAATGASFAWINANFPEAPDYFALRVAAIDEHHALAGEIGLERELHWGGSLWWEQQGREFDDYLESWRGLDYALDVVHRERFAELEGALAAPPERAIRFPREGCADPVAFTRRLLQSAAENGATLVEDCELQALELHGGRFTRARTTRGNFEAERVVVAAGARTGALLGEIGIHLPMGNRPGILVHTRPVAPLLRHVMLSPELHFRQQADGALLVGEDYGGEFTGDAHEVGRELVARLKRLLPGVAGLEVAHAVVGMRPIPADGLPVIGQPIGYEGVYVACMHSGITLAPLAGRLAAGEILLERAEPRLAPYRLERLHAT